MSNVISKLTASIGNLFGKGSDGALEAQTRFEPAGGVDINKPLAIPLLKESTDEQQRKVVTVGMVVSFILAAGLLTGAVLVDGRKAQFVDWMQAMDAAVQEGATAIKLAPLGSKKDYEAGDYAETVLAARLNSIRSTTLTPLGVDLTGTVEKLEQFNGSLKSVMERESALTGFATRTTRVHGQLRLAAQALEQAVLADQAAGGSANTPIYVHMRDSAVRASELMLQFVVVEGNAETNLRILTNDLNDLVRLAGYFKGVGGVYVDAPTKDIGDAIGKVGDMSPELTDYRRNLETAIDSLTYVRRVGEEVRPILDPLIEEVRGHTDTLRGSTGTTLLYVSAVIMALAGLACMILQQAIHAHVARRQAIQARREQDETDEAIIRIMQELMPISEGNLTARATVTEHVTGAIADRVNMAAESLQLAISQVKQAVGVAADLMVTIKSKSEGAIEDFEDAAFHASDSRNVAELGSTMVSDAVAKMDEARERMQDVSKRVKRLGEVSQAITSIVDLIEEVTQKTSILALNTSLKAAEAGEEGQAFQVIAKEIRDLSEDARKALRQIAQNVQMIQGETQSVIHTVETLTQDVVEGSRLWEDARITLSNITSSSSQIENMVKRLSDLAKEQADKAASATGVMGVLADSMGQFQTEGQAA